MALFESWRAERDRKRRTDEYVVALMADPSSADVAWLTEAGTRGDDDHALWELRYARRALGLLAAERDALDDRTSSAVAHALDDALSRDANVADEMLDVAERQFNARLSAYRDVLTARAGAATAARLGQTLFAFCGGSFRDVDERVKRGGELLLGYLNESSERLRTLFGTANLPEDVVPSSLPRA